jgi:hypothetical protein
METRRRVFRPNELREAYGLTRDQVFKLIQTGHLRSFTVGRARYIRVEDIEDFIQRRMEQD